MSIASIKLTLKEYINKLAWTGLIIVLCIKLHLFSSRNDFDICDEARPNLNVFLCFVHELILKNWLNIFKALSITKSKISTLDFR
jgi:hypothetical protein